MWWRELGCATRLTDIFGQHRGLDVHPSAQVAADVTMDVSGGPIVIGAWTRICHGAHLEGPLRIGADCLIGNLTVIRGATVIGCGTRIGFAAEIKNSIIGEKVSIGPQCFVADSKIEREAYLGAQVRTSNHRLDKASVGVVIDGRIVDTGLKKLGCLIGARAALGIQVIVLPGREIAPDSLFAPRITIERNLPTGRYRPRQLLETY